MEALLLKNFPFVDKGSLIRLLLHVVEEYFVSCLRKNGQEELEYFLVLVPILLEKTKTMESIVCVYLPPIVPGVNMDLVRNAFATQLVSGMRTRSFSPWNGRPFSWQGTSDIS